MATNTNPSTSLTPRTDLLASLERHNAAFTTLLSLIPAQYYIQPTQEEADSKWLKNKKRKTGEEIKEHKRKVMASKLDPENQKTTADIMFASDPSFAMDIDVDDAGVAKGESGSKKLKTKATPIISNGADSSVGAKSPALALAQLPPTKSISDLKQRLADKLAGFKRRRGAWEDQQDAGYGARAGAGAGVPDGDDEGEGSDDEEDEDDSASGSGSGSGSGSDGESDEDEPSSRAVSTGNKKQDGSGGNSGNSGNGGTASRDALEAESRRRRGEMRDKRRRERKEARRAEKAHSGANGAQGHGQGHGQGAKGKDGKKDGVVKKEDRNMPTAKTQLIVPQSSNNLTLPPIALPGSRSKHSSNTGDFRNPTIGTSNAGSSSFKHLSNPAHALASLQKHDRHLAGMDDTKRAEAVEAERWAKALHRAEGGKVVDSEKVLKKAVKRVEKTKSKSGKEWNERKKQLSDAQAVAIKKRNDNIASRNQARRDKKTGVKKKDGHRKDGKKGGAGGSKGYKGKNPDQARPGFEGKRKGGKGK